ncbi:hypothetical protein KRR39_10430 [Nocardioides panacis]|uniref:Uncharacterized protein n=1 Tax=Nocardioides panacis TaxID=2849501 RepID=A0A975T1U8_9ACTN|nr:hypothetical protein [Nocardioides panacis]QWZ10108.1 hypothetical protein KRR39_10430 [Nocardioides panacis]
MRSPSQNSPTNPEPTQRTAGRAECHREPPQPCPEYLAAIRDARAAVASARTSGHSSSRTPTVEQHNLFSALSAYAQSMTELGLPVPHTLLRELHMYQDLVTPHVV